ncbi:DUF3574 domain-containing protein [Vibrio vulnificus]|uniref:DUF3574 domain-containing protein n=1 Tax=Vibrio vulnificus TaxID=672 RepID=UPI001CDCC017|nr:DUF3574 domain-containing protein [Vibrio vulnificus]MCA3903602.1 DUF3574 domain-containing protein [Vibrio vulnificus]
MRNGSDMLNVTLYFGLDRRENVPVSEEEWAKFVKEEITPAFPKGLTVTHGRGQYLAKSGTLYDEDTKVLHIIYEREPDSDDKIEHLRSSYMKKYDQESVLRVDHHSMASW